MQIVLRKDPQLRGSFYAVILVFQRLLCLVHTMDTYRCLEGLQILCQEQFRYLDLRLLRHRRIRMQYKRISYEAPFFIELVQSLLRHAYKVDRRYHLVIRLLHKHNRTLYKHILFSFECQVLV